MKIVIRTFIFHVMCILIFSFIYLYFANDFYSIDENKKNKDYLDYFLLSTAIQAGVGISVIIPSTTITKFIMIVQQLLMISTHIFTLYFLTL
jgi:hypothetical protein